MDEGGPCVAAVPSVHGCPAERVKLQQRYKFSVLPLDDPPPDAPLRAQEYLAGEAGVEPAFLKVCTQTYNSKSCAISFTHLNTSR